MHMRVRHPAAPRSLIYTYDQLISLNLLAFTEKAALDGRGLTQ